MSEKIQITLIGKDDVLAAILAEQTKGKVEFDLHLAADIQNAPPTSDVWVLTNNAASPQLDDAPLCIRVTDDEEDGDLTFKKPLRLAQFLDTALSGAKLRRRKQPRALDTNYVFKPFARLVENTATKNTVVLTEKEASFLCAILDAGDTGLLRKDAMTQLWGYHPDAESHAVDTTLYRLRQKLQELGDVDKHLVNEGGIYRWKNA
jgi:hypothetical protein